LLRQLLARGFRNLDPLEWEVAPGTHLLLGGTGAGKTSVLEAVYAVATTRSFRAVRLAECVRRDGGRASVGGWAPRAAESGAFWLAAEVGDGVRERLEVTWSDERGLERRLNGERVPLARHLFAQPVLAWTSADVAMLLGSPVERRRFLDRGIVYRRADALAALGRYRHLLAQKRSLLRRGAGRAEIAPWNALLAPAAASIVTQRAAFVDALRSAYERVGERSGLASAHLEIRYRPSPVAAAVGEGETLEALEQALGSELAAGRPLTGPHRDRLELLWRGEEVARRASAGERKAIGLLLLLAQGEVLRRDREGVVLLVDDADAELDRSTLGAVWALLSAHPQVLATSNRPEVWNGLRVDSSWRVDAGRVDHASI
jgi:DNA replication and repair protein RecF